ncbi:MAG: DUF4838 domain-containing protein, partial [Armatimonadota bacterium]
MRQSAAIILSAALVVPAGAALAAETTFTDDFSAPLGKRWQAVSGEWGAREGRLVHASAEGAPHDGPTWAAPEDLQLASEGATDYVIVTPATPTAVDSYAVRELAGYLRQMTGAEFPAVAPQEWNPEQPAIFVGVSPPVVKRFGADPVAELRPQEHVSRSEGRDIFLHGEGVHGNLHAVFEFLESSLGWRWYTVHRDPVCPRQSSVRWAPFRRKPGFTFASRELAQRWGLDFYYQNGTNMGYERRSTAGNPAYVSYLRCDNFVHTSFAYIPPTPESKYADRFEWMAKKDYFTTDPEFFSFWTNGQRVPDRQLCFSNPGLRAELTKNILRHIQISPDNDIITVDAADTPGHFCYCDRCSALEEKFGGPGGPLYDYILELCGLLQAEHPTKFVKILAYRRSQTQKPPKLPDGARLPQNLIVSFAPIEDCYFADWTHPDAQIQETYRDLVAWGRITDHLWAWLYPNPWGTGVDMPVGNIQRIVTNLRLMRDAGCSGVFIDHQGFNERSGFSELQAYLIMRLMRDVDCDADAVIAESTDYLYGSAGPLMRTYIAELEQGRKAMSDLPPHVGYKSRNYDDQTFPYLTAANIHRWQRLFDRMVALTAHDPDALTNVRLARRELDVATLWKWFDLRETHPGYYTDHEAVVERINTINQHKSPIMSRARPIGGSAVRDFVAVIKGGGRQKPLPAEFDGIDPSRVRVFLPTTYARGMDETQVIDPDAAFGYAVRVHKPDIPFQIGFYQWISRDPPTGNAVARVSLGKDDITPGAYQLVTLGTVTVTEDCWLWFSARSWQTHLSVGERLYAPGEENRWEAYVSLR